jgi:hypothetical protein
VWWNVRRPLLLLLLLLLMWLMWRSVTWLVYGATAVVRGSLDYPLSDFCVRLPIAMWRVD